MSSRKNIQKQCPDLRPRNGMMSPPKTPTIIPVSETFSATVWKLWGNTHHNSGVLNIQRNGMEALGSSGGALGDLWGALESSGGALRSSGGSLTKIKTKSHIHFEFLADPSLINSEPGSPNTVRVTKSGLQHTEPEFSGAPLSAPPGALAK